MGIFDDIPMESSPAQKAAPVPAQNGRGLFDDIPMEKPTASRFADTAKSLGSGLARGAVGLAGIPGDVAQLVDWGSRRGTAYVMEKAGLLPAGKTAADAVSAVDARRAANPNDPGFITTKRVIDAASNAGVPGLDYQPETRAGEYARTIGEFVPAAAIGGGSALSRLGNVVKYGAIPGAAVEAVRPAAESGALPAWAPAAAGIAAGGLSGLASALATRPSVAQRAISQAAAGMTPEQLAATDALMRDATSAGLPLTRAEAAQQVTNGATRLADLQRLVEGQGGLRPFMAERPAQVEAAGRHMVGQIAETPAAPSMIGPKASDAAQSVIAERQAGINAQTRPLYDEVATRRGGPPVANALAKDPIYKETIAEVRNNPTLNRTIASLPDDNAAVIDLVQRRMSERAANARMPGQASTSNLAAANLEDARGGAITAAERITGSRPEKGVIGSYEAARAEQSRLREEQLAPLMAGPIGKLADKPETRAAIDALFPVNPIPNSAGEVKDAVAALSAKNPWAARQLVRAHIESVFNKATKDIQSGLNQFGGANFKAQLTGNSQQAENLAAAINGLPNGDTILPGFDRMLEIMAATGQRQRIGSQTAFNQELQAAMKTGGAIGEGTALAAGAGLKLPARIFERYQQWNLGKNTDELARLLADPKASKEFSALASAPRGSAKAAAAAARLVYIARDRAEKNPERK
jgi:hypothetical protein